MFESIAIVGMACTFPQARHLHQFWSNIVHKRSAIRSISNQRCSPIYYDPTSHRSEGNRVLKFFFFEKNKTRFKFFSFLTTDS